MEHVILLVNLYMEVVEVEEKPSVLNDLFVSREENICALTEFDKKRIKELTKDNNTYQMLLDKLEDLSSDDISKAKVKDSLESYIDKVNVIGSYENEKFYLYHGSCPIASFLLLRKTGRAGAGNTENRTRAGREAGTGITRRTSFG